MVTANHHFLPPPPDSTSLSLSSVLFPPSLFCSHHFLKRLSFGVSFFGCYGSASFSLLRFVPSSLGNVMIYVPLLFLLLPSSALEICFDFFSSVSTEALTSGSWNQIYSIRCGLQGVRCVSILGFYSRCFGKIAPPPGWFDGRLGSSPPVAMRRQSGSMKEARKKCLISHYFQLRKASDQVIAFCPDPPSPTVYSSSCSNSVTLV
ncbi:hypothetical protein TIFTF001_027499 [Ficus carica]|uniref:Uncharacterized protein n=1 Tax=Ficus carica TaxID=3494 RepID=A0AA88J0C6_FICCA|nr:hypothetical protein TIFTF001_027499 [Ficus carica]